MVLGDLLLSVVFLVRFEMRLLVFAVAVGDGFAVIARSEGLLGGVWFGAVGTSVGSHSDTAETRREDVVGVDSA